MKHLSNYTKEEFYEMFKEFPRDMVEIVYDYYHRSKTYTVEAFAIKKGISTSTLYRYVRRIKGTLK